MKNKKEFNQLDYKSQLLVLAFTRTILQTESESNCGQDSVALVKDSQKVRKTVQQLNF